jgi:hypothetical protein
MAEIAFPDRVQSGWQSVRRARHSARAPRYLASAVLLIFFALGIRAAFFPGAIASPPRIPGETTQTDAPSQDFALQFARAYLSYDAARPGLRARALAPYIRGAQLEPGAGLTPTRGRQLVRWVEVASDQRALAGGRVITVAASVSDQRLPLYLAVTVEHPRGGPLQLLGYPSLVGAPSIATTAAPQPREPVSDPALSEVVDRVLRNYLAGAAPDLKADLAADAEVTLPTRRLGLLEVQQLVWLGAPGSGAVLATLTASDSGGTTYTLTYELGIAYRERPYVDFIEVVPTGS